MITEKLSQLLKTAFEKCGYEASLGVVTISDRVDLCQFQCNGALAGAKLYKKAPITIANEVVSNLCENELIQKVEIVLPGFINITLKDLFLIDTLERIENDKHLGIPQAKTNETIFLDYGGPNVAKPLHIGHLRSAIIGESLKRLVKATGRTAIADVHLGDWGLQIGLVIAELLEREPVLDITVELLNELYPLASKKSKENEEFKNKAKEITAKLQKGYPHYVDLWKKIVSVSIADLKKSYTRLLVDFDLWCGESDAEKYVDALMDKLNAENLLYESDGAMVVNVSKSDDKFCVPPVIIKKSDNSSIYATTDLATIIQRQKEFNPNEIWYVVDNRQSLHFTQVFRCAKKANIIPSEMQLAHLGFGTMNGHDGKPYKTRDGGVMQLSKLLDLAVEKSINRLNNSQLEDNLKEQTAEKIAIAAIKFGDLMNHRSKDYVFDIDKFLSSEGKTGVYLLYTIARINSILKKATDNSIELEPIKEIYSEEERALLLKLILSPEAFLSAFFEKAPNIICENAYQIANAFSKMYHENPILKEPNLAKRNTLLHLCSATKKVLMMHLDILGIEAVDAM